MVPKWREVAIDIHERFVKERIEPWGEEDKRFLALALCGEAGELANFVKKEWRDGQPRTEDIQMELADIRIYLELLAIIFEVDLDAACEEKLKEVEGRLALRDKAAEAYARQPAPCEG